MRRREASCVLGCHRVRTSVTILSFFQLRKEGRDRISESRILPQLIEKLSVGHPRKVDLDFVDALHVGPLFWCAVLEVEDLSNGSSTHCRLVEGIGNISKS